MVPTEKGLQWLKEHGFSHKQSDKEGGIHHQYWKQRLAELFSKQGYTVEIEVPLTNNQSVDVVVSHQQSRVAVEIETGTNTYLHIMANITKCLDHFNGVVSFILDVKKAERVKMMVKDDKLAIVADEKRCCEAVLAFLKHNKGDTE
jgi:hypothetical protein